MSLKLPINITSKMIRQCHNIELICRYLSYLMTLKYGHKLHTKDKFKLQCSLLSMEDKGLNEIQLKHIISSKKTATAFQLREIQNINLVFKNLKKWDPLSIKDFKNAHAMLMNGLSMPIGCWRKEQVCVFEGARKVHIPPRPQAINDFMRILFSLIKGNKDISWIIKACIFHYGVQYIHPFFDGNGRMGRLWQHLLILKASSLFNTLLIGDIIRKDPAGYYKSLDKSDLAQDGGIFIEFCLSKLNHELKKLGKHLKVPSLLSASRKWVKRTL